MPHRRPREPLTHGWHPLALSREVTTELGQAWLLDTPWVVWRDGGGVQAFVDRCPHRCAPLSAGTILDDGTLQCGYHGWRFATDGRCTTIPALRTGDTIPGRARLHAPVAVRESCGIVWIAPNDPPEPVSAHINHLNGFDRLRGAFAVGLLQPSRAEVDPGMMLDNFLDVAHFPFVHAETFGTDGSDETGGYLLEQGPHTFSAVTEHEFAHHEDPGVATGERPLRQTRRMTYTYLPPYTATLRLDYLDAGGTNILVFAVQPERDGRCRVYTTMIRDDLNVEQMPDAVAFEERVLAEDLAVQVRMRTSPSLDLTTEVHTKADRLTIELRRTLAGFLASAGSAAEQ